MDKEHMKSYLLELHNMHINILELYRIFFIQYYSVKYNNKDITLSEVINKIFYFIDIVCDDDIAQAIRSDYIQFVTDTKTSPFITGEQNFYNSVMDFYEDNLLKPAIHLSNYRRLTMYYIHQQYAMKRAERIKVLVEEFPEISECIINTLKE